MRQCPACGFHNGDDRDRCLRCSSRLGHVAPPDLSRNATEGAPERRIEWLGKLRSRLESIGQMIVEGEIPEYGRYRYPAGAAFMSPIPGLPQFYTYQPVKGILYALVVIALYVWAARMFFQPDANTSALVLILAVLFTAADGYQAALRINGRPTRPRYLLGYWFGFIFIFGMTLSLSQWWLYVFGIQLVAITTDDLRPAFKDGDRVLMIRWPVLAGGYPRRGDIVYYSPPYWSYELGPNSTSIRPIRTFGVVTGLPEDRMHWSNGGPIAVNDKVAPPEWLPLLPAGVVPNFDQTVPQGRVGVLLSTPVSEFSLGPSWGGEAPMPRSIAAAGAIMKGFEQANLPERDRFQGVVMLRYHPPERRAWFGRGSGVPTNRSAE